MPTSRFWKLLPPASLLVLISAIPGMSSSEPGFDIEERIAAQGRIERVYYSHQLGATRPFEVAVPRSILEKKVRDSLKQSAALEVFWHSPMTREMLDREIARMEAGTRSPERLRELYAALGNDRVLIRECLARPALADRLIRSFFAFDRRFQTAASEQAESLRRRLSTGALDPESNYPGRSVLNADREAGSEESFHLQHPLTPDILQSFTEPKAEWPAGVTGKRGAVGPVLEERDAFVLSALLDATPGKRRVARYRIPKQPYEQWWEEARNGLNEAAVGTAASDGDGASTAETESLTPGSACPSDDSWSQRSLSDPPSARSNHTAVWTGSMMLVWGGQGYEPYLLNTGGRYDPATDTWTPISVSGAPSARRDHLAVWTGSRMVVWGGRDLGSTYTETGGQYDPATDTWSPSSTLSAPPPGAGYLAAWAGGRMVVWNSFFGAAGARYNPSLDVWESLADSPVGGRSGVSMVSTGDSIIIWGGRSGSTYFDTGARYTPSNDSWTLTSTIGAPTPRDGHSAVWTGTEMLIWGGNPVGNTGRRYNPSTDSWVTMSSVNAPSLTGHSAAWVGGRMVVWSETPYPYTPPVQGGRYDPATNAWDPLSSLNAPAGLGRFSVVAAGNRMIVWGGIYTGPQIPEATIYFGTGNRYDPATDSWTPTSAPQTPGGRSAHAAIWTGNRMIVWGGQGQDESLNSGGRYDPATDTWTPMSTVGAPPARLLPSAIWTGDRMVIWGGVLYQNGQTPTYTPLDSGGRYDPISDAWTATSTTGAPSPRYIHSMVWTGSRMIVWGGYSGTAALDTGGLYDPVNDTWGATSMLGAPASRYNHRAVLAGGSMIVWGGENGVAQFNDGRRFDPAGNTWSPMSTAGAPSARSSHSAISTGSTMVVWGGWDRVTRVDTGGRYDPLADQWSGMTTIGAPPGRTSQSTIWTGSRMIVWGGYDGTNYLDSGGRYDPAADTWSSTSLIGSPRRRYGHTAVSAGDSMLIWGGIDKNVNGFGLVSYEDLATGGQYCLCPMFDFYRDADADGLGDSGQLIQACASPPGYVSIAGDCNDLDPGLWATPSEALNLFFSDGITLNWSPPSAPGANTVRYDLIRSSSPSNFVASALCTTSDTPLLSATDSSTPPVANRFYYLVRARNGCPGSGLGSLGNASNGTPRTALTCP